MRAALLPLATSVLFAGSYVAGKYTTLDLGPLTTTLLRYAVALAVLGLLAVRLGRPVIRMPPRDLARMLLLGLTGIVGYHYFFFSSLRYTEVANTAIINATSPVLTGLAAAVLIRERLAPAGYLGIAVAFVGVMVLVTDGDPARLTAGNLNRGDILMLLSVACWAAYALLLKTLTGRYSGYTLTFNATLYGVVVLIPMTLPEAPLAQALAMSRASLWSVLYMGVFASGAGYLLYAYSVEAIGPTRTASFVYSAVTVLVAGLAYLFFGEPVTWLTVASAALIVAGLHLVLRGGARST